MYLIEMCDGNKYKVIPTNCSRKSSSDVLYREFSHWQVLHATFIFETHCSHVYKSRFFVSDFLELGKKLLEFQNVPVLTRDDFIKIYDRKAMVLNIQEFNDKV